MAPPLLSRSPTVHYSQIAATLSREIELGKYKIGDRLPTEDELCVMYGSTRYATREALQILCDNGLITRRPRVGSTVIAKTGRARMIQRIDSVQDILSYPGETVRKHLHSEYLVAGPELAATLRCEVGTAWFRIQGLRFLKGSTVPLCHTDVYVLPEYAGITKSRKHSTTMIVQQIEEMFGVVAASTRIDIYADQISAGVAKLVDAKAGSPALTVIRSYFDEDDRAFEITVSTHPAARHTYSFLLKRERRSK